MHRGWDQLPAEGANHIERFFDRLTPFDGQAQSLVVQRQVQLVVLGGIIRGGVHGDVMGLKEQPGQLKLTRSQPGAQPARQRT